MTAAFTTNPSAINLPTLPDGWPIASYDTYQEAQRAVDHLADNEFPVQEVTIVGVEPMVVERVAARLTWGRVLGGGAASGAWLGLFVGLLLSLFTAGAGLFPILIGLVSGVVFGVASAAVRYGATRGQRDFVSHSQLVARRYDVLAKPSNAERGREMLGALAMRLNPQAL
jgi:heat induced stress protein YflT